MNHFRIYVNKIVCVGLGKKYLRINYTINFENINYR